MYSHSTYSRGHQRGVRKLFVLLSALEVTLSKRSVTPDMQSETLKSRNVLIKSKCPGLKFLSLYANRLNNCKQKSILLQPPRYLQSQEFNSCQLCFERTFWQVFPGTNAIATSTDVEDALSNPNPVWRYGYEDEDIQEESKTKSPFYMWG